MKTYLSFALASVFALLGCALVGGCSTTIDDVPSTVSEMGQDDFSTLRMTDIEGRSLVICDKKARGVLFIFASHTCPIANAYAPRIQQVYDEYSDRGIRCLLVQVDPSVSDEQLRTHAQEYELTLPVLHDKTQALVDRASATVTPQAVLFNPRGKIVYSGRIDNQYVDFGVKRRHPTSHDLINALEAFLAGEEVIPRTTKAIGCYIGDLSPAEASR
jgi:peroxiredoxin